MQTILIFLNSIQAMASGPSAPPSGSSDNPSGAAWLTLICGIASWFILPFVASVVGILVGRGELKAIEQGRSPASGLVLTQVGYYASIANVVITVLGGCISVAIVMLVWGGLIAGIGGLAIFGELAQQLP